MGFIIIFLLDPRREVTESTRKKRKRTSRKWERGKYWRIWRCNWRIRREKRRRGRRSRYERGRRRGRNRYVGISSTLNSSHRMIQIQTKRGIVVWLWCEFSRSVNSFSPNLRKINLSPQASSFVNWRSIFDILFRRDSNFLENKSQISRYHNYFKPVFFGHRKSQPLITSKIT